MFEAVSSINWANLSHSHGSAEEVPEKLVALTSSSADEQEEAIGYFWEYMFHQGSRYEASPYVVPFLFEALEQSSPPLQHQLIDLLRALGIGYGERFLPRGYDLAKEEQSFRNGSWDGLLSYEEARSCYYAVQERASCFNKYLHPACDHQTRLSASFAIAQFAQPLSALHSEVAKHIAAESDESQLQGLILCYGMLGRYAGLADAKILEPFSSPLVSPSLRLAAGIGTMTLLDSRTPPECIETLLTALREHWKVTSPRTTWQWWNEGDLLGHAALVLKLAGKEWRDSISKSLCATLLASDACTFAIPQTLLDVLFPDPKPAAGRQVSEFDDAQLVSLKILLQTSHWKSWMIDSCFLPSGLTGDAYRAAFRSFVVEATDGKTAAEPFGRSGNVSTWDFLKNWPKG